MAWDEWEQLKAQAADRPPAGDHRLEADDRSVSVHACAGPHRQVEVLREVLLRYDVTLPDGATDYPRVRNITSVPRHGARVVVR